ncbi:MAG: hypothetical protein IPK66_05745 [Rhodospirillales bacterium]|nr:hypothetical protein [Rhodospirillales bacterium]
MSDAASVLGADAVDLLLTLMEAPEAQLSGAALHDFYPDAGAALIHAGALKDDGHEPVITGMADHDDLPVGVTWRAEVGGYAYFSPSAGWVKVDGELLRRYRVEFAWLLTILSRQLRIPRTIEPKCLLEDVLWELGPAWIGHRKHMTPVFLGRRLRQRNVFEAACHALRERVCGRTGLLLTTGGAPPAFVMIPGQPVVVPLRTCFVIGAGLTVDTGNLASRLGGNLLERGQQPLQIIGEGRVVWFYGEKFEFPRGEKQRLVIVYLYEQYLQGIYNVSVARIITDLDLADGLRIEKLFKDSPAWNGLLTQRNGVCSFCWPDARADGSGNKVVAAE